MNLMNHDENDLDTLGENESFEDATAETLADHQLAHYEECTPEDRARLEHEQGPQS